ncbi:MAG: methionine adenosyltransferase domain-containing protein [Syntrophales bacterium]|jgi:S-adenosylmethionine synthetase|nr:methionine adenosyltransferase domain-containing protein [Syntrophales bacterium]MCK9528023.1 methionine adenosyltransferase domain-containing protein [Syntrophales bacterium]MDX9921400.1 methionine adenosyltransferase [Syntrophales bacterium]
MQISSESIKIGHPDIVADVIAAGIIADILDKESELGLTLETMPHCGLEVFLGKGMCLVGGEIRSRVSVDIDTITRRSVLSLGYNHAAVGLNGHLMGVLNAIIPQSPDICRGTDPALNVNSEIGAGDQGIMYGFACDETAELLPLPYVLVSRLMRAFEECGNPVFAPDGKGQVSVRYDRGTGKPGKLAKVLMSNAVDYRFVNGTKEKVKEDARRITFDCLSDYVGEDTEFLFNPTGEWQAVNSCSAADSGVTGRKLVVQFYGGYPGAQLGGGAVVNKTPEKVDCSAAFGARYVAKNIVAAGLATRCSTQLAYAIGIARPFSIYVDTFGTGEISDEKLTQIVKEVFDLTPAGMIRQFDLLKGDIYRKLPRTLFMDDYRWEKTDRIEELRSAAGRWRSSMPRNDGI